MDGDSSDKVNVGLTV